MIGVGASSRDLRLTAIVTVTAPVREQPLRLDSTVGEWLAHPVAGPLLISTVGADGASAALSDPAIMQMIESLPLDRLVAMSGGMLDPGILGPLQEWVATQSVS